MIMVSVVDKASVQLPTLHYGPSPLSLSRSLARSLHGGPGGLRVTAHEDLTSSCSLLRLPRAGLRWSFAQAPLVFRAGLLAWSFWRTLRGYWSFRVKRPGPLAHILHCNHDNRTATSLLLASPHAEELGVFRVHAVECHNTVPHAVSDIRRAVLDETAGKYINAAVFRCE